MPYGLNKFTLFPYNRRRFRAWCCEIRAWTLLIAGNDQGGPCFVDEMAEIIGKPCWEARGGVEAIASGRFGGSGVNFWARVGSVPLSGTIASVAPSVSGYSNALWSYDDMVRRRHGRRTLWLDGTGATTTIPSAPPELDFTIEAKNMEIGRQLVRPFPTLSVPEVIEVTPRVIVQSMAPGCPIRDIDPKVLDDSCREAIGADLVGLMLRGFFVDRIFHADPHPGEHFHR